jgi:hypothetical protein
MFAPVTDDNVPRIVALINWAYRGSGAASGWSMEASYLSGDPTTEDLLRADLVAKPDASLLKWEDGQGWPLHPSPRFRGIVYPPRRRARVPLPRQDANRWRRVDRQYSGQRPAHVQEQVRKDGAYALPVRAGGKTSFSWPSASPSLAAHPRRRRRATKRSPRSASSWRRSCPDTGPKWSRRDARRARSQLWRARLRTQGICVDAQRVKRRETSLRC